MPPTTSRFLSIDFMERLETYGYISVGISFLLLGMAVFVYGWWEFAETATNHVPKAILVLLNDLLLVVILLELFRTIVNFLKTGEISLEPFLHVGIIAAVRKILTVGAEMALARPSITLASRSICSTWASTARSCSRWWRDSTFTGSRVVKPARVFLPHTRRGDADVGGAWCRSG